MSALRRLHLAVDLQVAWAFSRWLPAAQPYPRHWLQRAA